MRNGQKLSWYRFGKPFFSPSPIPSGQVWLVSCPTQGAYTDLGNLLNLPSPPPQPIRSGESHGLPFHLFFHLCGEWRFPNSCGEEFEFYYIINEITKSHDEHNA